MKILYTVFILGVALTLNGCGDETVPFESEKTTVKLETEIPTENVEIPLIEDPVEQIEALNESIDDLNLLVEQLEASLPLESEEAAQPEN